MRKLPGGSGISVAYLRSARVGINAGKPIEDFGVQAKAQARTHKDLCANSLDLIRFACSELAMLENFRVELDPAPAITADGVHVTVTTRGVDALRFSVGQTPEKELRPVAPGVPTTFRLPFPRGQSGATPPVGVKVEGYVAARGTEEPLAVTRFRFPVREDSQE